MTNNNHSHGIDLWEASECSAECLIHAKTTKREHDARVLEESKNDINTGGGYSRRARR